VVRRYSATVAVPPYYTTYSAVGLPMVGAKLSPQVPAGCSMPLLDHRHSYSSNGGVNLYHENLTPRHGELFSTLSSSALLVGLRLTGYEPKSLSERARVTGSTLHGNMSSNHAVAHGEESQFIFLSGICSFPPSLYFITVRVRGHVSLYQKI
jgi:hypothetical protein